MKKIEVTYIDTSSQKNDSRPSYVAHSANPIAETLTRFHQQVGEALRHAPFLAPDELKGRLKQWYCIECGKPTSWSPYACIDHADPRGGDGVDD